MATADKTDIKDRIANNKLTKQILIDMVDSYIDSIDGPLDFETEAVLQIDGTTELGVKNDGRLYGRSLHNQGDVTGTTDQYIASGTYMPTLAMVANLGTVTPFTCQWIRVGNVVTVSGQVNTDPIAAATARFSMTIPIASAFDTINEAGGTGSAYAVPQATYAIYADTTNDKVIFDGVIQDTLNRAYFFTFTYLIK